MHLSTTSLRGWFTFGYLADPLMFSVTGLWHKHIGQVAVHGTLPPVVVLGVILDESRRHLQENTRSGQCDALLLSKPTITTR